MWFRGIPICASFPALYDGRGFVSSNALVNASIAIDEGDVGGGELLLLSMHCS